MMGLAREFEEYAGMLAEALGHADRVGPFKDYCTGLTLSGERKSAEPMAARVSPTRVSSAHQSLHHFVSLPIVYRLYLPKDWAADAKRRAKARVPQERDYQELKQVLGLGHFEGRGWRGIHHHATLCIAAYRFLVAQRAQTEARSKKTAALGSKRLPCAANFRPRGSPEPRPTP